MFYKPQVWNSGEKEGPSRQRLIKRYANAISFAPCDTARTVPVISSNYQFEIIWNAKLTCDLEAGSAFRDVANSAGDSAVAVERNRSELQDAVSRDFPAF
jgi:hypothetical protein